MNAASASIYTDFQGIASLKAKARTDSEAALDEVAEQFESLFMQMMLKSMRQAGQGKGIMDSDQSLFYRDMYDQQLAIHLAKGGGLGLAEVIKRQLSAQTGSVSNPGLALEDYQLQARTVAVPASAAAPTSAETEMASPEEFVQRLWPHAREAAQRLGQHPETLLAQAALETGWGQHMIRLPNGQNSYNLFGIKADGRWDGERAVVTTLEFEQGVPVRRQAAFRAYASFQESFEDYVEFIMKNPRYEEALLASSDGHSYLSALQDCGYATDPRYAEKIVAILDRPEMAQARQRLKSFTDRP